MTRRKNDRDCAYASLFDEAGEESPDLDPRISDRLEKMRMITMSFVSRVMHHIARKSTLPLLNHRLPDHQLWSIL
jgi:hypothetical protein